MDMDTSLIWGLVRLLLALIVIVPAAFFVTRWYGRKHLGEQNLRIKEALSLGTNRALYVVQWEGKEYLLGVTNQSITLLDQEVQVQADLGEVLE